MYAGPNGDRARQVEGSARQAAQQTQFCVREAQWIVEIILAQ